MAPSSKSVPIPIHRSASHTPSMMVNAKKYLSDRPQLLDCPRCKLLSQGAIYASSHMPTNGSSHYLIHLQQLLSLGPHRETVIGG
ncbi:hypothetical protein GCK32_006166 [Trichostrongylus colubriformis]|uniref:Uncharacterized protein n=1 Tax=Trichostrongylus colubriformis TaxID=6319 RepID=A0AAN8IUX5_TRICO